MYRNNNGLSLEDIRTRVPAIFTDHPHEETSSRYVHIPTQDVIKTMMAEGFLPVEVRSNNSRDLNFSRHMVKFRHQGDAGRKLTVGDTALEVILRNSHDGTSAYEFFCGLFRLICSNGAVVSDGVIESVRVRHVGSREKVLGQVIEGAYSVIENAPKVLDAPRKWSTIRLDQPEQEAFAQSALVARYGEDQNGTLNAPFQPKHLLAARRPADIPDDLWTVFNRVQENITQGGSRTQYRDTNNRRRVASIRAVKGIDSDVKLNRALWRLADEMARLKTAA